MELRHLRYFVTVAELGSVSRAAEKLFIAQPPLSAQIRQLEQELGVTLFLRQPRGVKLTPAGESYLEDARAILARTEQAAARARERQSGRRAALRLGMVPSAVHSVLPGLLDRLAQAGLQADVEVSDMITAHQLQALRNDELDLGFGRPGEDGWPDEAVAAIDDPYSLALPADSALAGGSGVMPLAAAAREVFVGFSRYQDVDFFDRTQVLCAEAGFKPNIRHHAGQFFSVLGLVARNLGVAIVPASLGTLAFPGVVFRRLATPGHRGRLVLLRGSRLEQDAWTEQVVELARQELEALAARMAVLDGARERQPARASRRAQTASKRAARQPAQP
ncbi:LysR family transcriptional regulator [Pigmentiphaga sp. NML080357]|uniref:LysR substrate-binding domain-containing protein n=1 Tax=Pigmentiphaga sp. NML080357 TaxID=2008675 RepID=UPI000B41825C|nr:LysR substrate-binding domain-containing protein [Pigmentiphaga sp. NML080357]OVZ60420.1 LysR family transcriptional regulator [Pigmentiphaga sp. NML080357]